MLGLKSVRSDKVANSQVVFLLLLRQGVESNPGPMDHDMGNLNSIKKSKVNLKLRTYNCNGLGKIDKLRRVLRKATKEVSEGGIVLLQETHVKRIVKARGIA